LRLAWVDGDDPLARLDERGYRDLIALAEENPSVTTWKARPRGDRGSAG